MATQEYLISKWIPCCPDTARIFGRRCCKLRWDVFEFRGLRQTEAAGGTASSMIWATSFSNALRLTRALRLAFEISSQLPSCRKWYSSRWRIRGHQGKQHAPVFSDLPDDATGVAMAEAIKENNMLQSFRTCHWFVPRKERPWHLQRHLLGSWSLAATEP